MKYHVLTLFPEMIRISVRYQHYGEGLKKRKNFSSYGKYPGFC